MSVMGRVGRLWGVLLSACAVLVVSAAATPPGALASTTLGWGTGVKAALPANVGTDPEVELNGVSCASPANCTAVGRYRDTSEASQGLLVTKSLGVWTTGVEATLPTGANTDPVVGLGSVSCASAGNCAAVGGYKDASGDVQGLLLSQSSGTWAAGVEAVLPVTVTGNPQVSLNSVSCGSAGNCTAVGEFTDPFGESQGLLLSKSSGGWSAGVEPPVPVGGEGVHPGIVLGSVSCTSAGNCSAVGDYTDGLGNNQGLLLTETSGSWSAAEAVPPTPAASNPSVTLYSVSCVSAGNCTAVGDYEDGSSHFQAMRLTETSGTWATGVKLAAPSGAATDPEAYLQSVSCTATGSCSADGGYNDSSGDTQGMVVTETSGTWGSAAKAILPAGTAGNPEVSMGSVSCSSAGNCAAVGNYSDSAGHGQGAFFSQTSGHWATGVKALLPTGVGTDPKAVLDRVSCTTAIDCTAVGRYSDTVGIDRGVLFTAAKASPRLSVGAPSSATASQTLGASVVAASLSLGASPVGTLQFRVFGPQPAPPSSCVVGGTVVGGAVSVSGNRAYHPAAGFVPKAAGTYWWYARYGGDFSDNAAASACGASMARTVVKHVPAISGFKQSHKRWREGKALPTIAAVKRKAPVGTAFTFAVNQPASVKLVFKQHNKVKGVLSLSANAGTDRITFQGRLSRTKRLAPGSYSVTITGTNADGVTSASKTLSFTIVKA